MTTIAGRSYGGAAILPHAARIAEIATRHGCASVLDVGTAAPMASSRVMTGPSWTGLLALAGNPDITGDISGRRFDLVVATHWLSTLERRYIGAAVDTLHRAAAKAICIIEPMRAGTVERADFTDGWDRAAWAYQLGRGNDVEVTLAATIIGPGKTRIVAPLKSVRGVWSRVA